MVYKSGCFILSINTAVTCEYCNLEQYSDKCKEQQAKGQIMIGIYYCDEVNGLSNDKD